METPTYILECEPFYELEIEFTGDDIDLTHEESALRDHIRKKWPVLWPALRDQLAETIDSYEYGKSLSDLIQELPHCLGVSFSPNSESDEDWALDLIVPLPNGHHEFYVSVKDDKIVSSGGCF